MNDPMTDIDVVNLWEDTVGDTGRAPEGDELVAFAKAVVRKFGAPSESPVIDRLLKELAVSNSVVNAPLVDILNKFAAREQGETEVLNRFREALEYRGYKPGDEPLFAILDQYAALTITPVEASLLADEGLRARVAAIMDNPGQTHPRPQRTVGRQRNPRILSRSDVTQEGQRVTILAIKGWTTAQEDSDIRAALPLRSGELGYVAEPSRGELEDALEAWRVSGRRMHAALLDIWRALGEDREYGTFGEDPEQVSREFFAGTWTAPTTDGEQDAPAVEGEPDKIIREARAWLTRLTGDAAWAHSPEIREAREHERRIVRDLIEGFHRPVPTGSDAAPVSEEWAAAPGTEQKGRDVLLEAGSWLARLDGDSHWARSTETRASHDHDRRVLRELIEGYGNPAPRATRHVSHSINDHDVRPGDWSP